MKTKSAPNDHHHVPGGRIVRLADGRIVAESERLNSCPVQPTAKDTRSPLRHEAVVRPKSLAGFGV
jgi:hypothetical protein